MFKFLGSYVIAKLLGGGLLLAILIYLLIRWEQVSVPIVARKSTQATLLHSDIPIRSPQQQSLV